MEPRGRGGYGRWRAASLLAVYVLMVVHIVHWRLSGRTLAPVELNEVMYTLEAGIVTAGFVFMTLAMCSVSIFGRFFCSWGCHILAIEDGSAWLLRQAGIRPKPIRSRLLLFVPSGALFYMFVWPQIARLIDGRAAPPWRIMSPEEPWGSFVTDDFWRNLPGPWIAMSTFLVCGVAVVYLLGSRSFCTYVCPYGAAFAIADRFAPGKILRVGSACDGCGACTAVCKSNILVHQEIRVFGKVVSPACLKDLDCVAACPDRGLKWGFTRPALFQSWSQRENRARRFDVSIGEDLLMAGVFIAGVLSLRGLYDVIPFLLSLGISLLLAWMSVAAWRLSRRSRVDLSHVSLKKFGCLTLMGRAFVALVFALGLLVCHSAFIRWHEVQGQTGLDRLREAIARGDRQSISNLVPQVIGHLEVCDRWGFVRSPQLEQRLASAHEWSETPLAAEPYLRRLMERQPAEPEAYLRLSGILTSAQRLDAAAAVLVALDEVVMGCELTLATPVRRRIWAAHVALSGHLRQEGREADADQLLSRVWTRPHQ